MTINYGNNEESDLGKKMGGVISEQFYGKNEMGPVISRSFFWVESLKIAIIIPFSVFLFGRNE